MLWHPGLEKRWPDMPVFQQILMICNELNRAENLRRDPAEYKNALERALELMDFSVDDMRMRSRLREFLRARELVAALYAGQPVQSSLATIQRGLVQLSAEAWRVVGGG